MKKLFCALLLAAAGCSQLAPAAPAPASRDEKPVSLEDLRCSRPADEHGPCEIYDVSMIELLARPEVFDHKNVRVFGFVQLGFESNGLYLHREDYERGLHRNGVWLNPPGGSRPYVNSQYALVEGMFDARNAGHLGMWSGTINASRLEAWKSAQSPILVVPGKPVR